MPTLSTGKLQLAIRKTVASVLHDTVELINRFHSAEEIVDILQLKCGINIDVDTLLKAFSSTSGDCQYSLPLNYMSIGEDENEVLYVYKGYRLHSYNGEYVNMFGCFESDAAAEQVDISGTRQRFSLRSIPDITIEEQLKSMICELLEKDKEKRRKRDDNKRPVSASARKPPQKKAAVEVEEVTTTNEENDRNDDSLQSTNATNGPIASTTMNEASLTEEVRTETVVFVMGNKLGKMTVAVGSDLHKQLMNNVKENTETKKSEDQCEEVTEVDDGRGEEEGIETEIRHTQHRDSTRKEYTRGWKSVKVGNDTVIIPKGYQIVIEHNQTRLKKKVEHLDKFTRLFAHGRKRCCFSEESMLRLAAARQSNTGGSDFGTSMMIAATVSVIIDEMGLHDKVTFDSIAHGCPSESSLANAESDLAAMSFLNSCKDIRDSGAKSGYITTDKGHRKGMDHLVKVLHYPAIDEDGNPVIRHVVLDADRCGSTSQDVADAIAKSWKLYRIFLPQFVILGGTGDSGGGGSIQTIIEPLITLGVFDESGRFIECDMHALAKPFEVGCQAAFGTQGIGKGTIFQLAYAAISLFRKIKEKGGLSLLDEYAKLAMDKYNNDDVWKAEAEELFKQAVRDYEEIESTSSSDDEGDAEESDNNADDSIAGHRNLQLPVFTRWTSVLKGLKWLKKDWISIYFLSVAVGQKESSNSQLGKIANDVQSLMYMRPETSGAADNDSNTDTDGNVDVDSQSTSADNDADTTNPQASNLNLSPGDTPILLAQCHFLCAFGDAFYSGWFDMAMKADPKFGTDSHGHQSRRLVERTYVMAMELEDMINHDKYMTLPVFADYVKALDGLPELGDVKKGGKDFMKAAVDVFFRNFENSLNKHVIQHWTSKELLPYLIGGTPVVVKEFIRWLSAATDGSLEADTFFFSNDTVTLYGLSSKDGHTVQLSDMMWYLTKDISAGDILNDAIVAPIKQLLFQSLETEETVDFLDSGTWSGVDYSPVRKMIHERIVCHASNQQRVECTIQVVNMVSRTTPGEGRRTARVISHARHIHDYNRKSVDKKQASKATLEEKTRVRRTKGSERVEGLLKHSSDLIKDAIEEKNRIGIEKYKEVYNYFHKGTNKTSAIEVKKNIDGMAAALTKERVVKKSQRVTNLEVTSSVGGSIELAWFAKTRNNLDLLRKEIAHREIKDNNNNTLNNIDEEPLKSMGKEGLKDLIKLDEYTNMAREGKTMQVKDASCVKAIKPQSQALKDSMNEYLSWKDSK